MKKNLFVLLAVLLIAAVTFSVVLAGDGCEGKKFIPERIPRKCLQQTPVQEDGQSVSDEDKAERQRVNKLYSTSPEPEQEEDLSFPFMDFWR